MANHNQDGVANVVVALALTVVLFIVALIFGIWAFSSRQDYKNNTDQKVAAAVAIAKNQQIKTDNAQFAQAEKSPLKTYNGPEAYGSIVLQFPKTWSALVDDTDTNGGSTLIEGYFYPDILPSITNADNNSSTSFALRLAVLSQPYSQVVGGISPGAQQNGKPPISVTPYALPKLPKTVGVEVQGTLPNQKTGTMIILPLRSETLELWTEGSEYTSDFDNFILPNFSFSP